MYLFYVDESGSRDPDTGRLEDGTHSKDWLYVVSAVALFEMRWKEFYHPIVQRKRELLARIRAVHGSHLDLSDAEIKSNWVRNAGARAKREFLARLSDPDLEALVGLYYEQFCSLNMPVISVIFDKRFLRGMTAASMHARAWEFLCERVQMFMRELHPKHRAVLIADDMGHRENHALAMRHTQLLERATTARLRLDHIVELPLFVRSELSEGVQLADLCAYSVYRAFKDGNLQYKYFVPVLSQCYRSGRTAITKVDGLKIYPAESPLHELMKAKEKGSEGEQPSLPF
jgi:hypothetical protein